MVLRSAALSVLLFFAVDARAGACGGYFQVSAIGPKLARNGVVLLDTSTDRVEIEKALPNAKFVSGKTAIAAKVVRKLDGGRLQVLLAPTADLPGETSVHLAVGVAEIDARLAAFELPTTAATDEVIPTWSKPPSVGKRSTASSNKGDSVDVYDVRTPLEAPAFVLAKIESEKQTAFAIYPAGKDGVSIGTTGCNTMWWVGATHGPFRVELTAIGASGRETKAPGKPLVLSFP
ncbi:MAG: hypothetical protein ACXWUG_01485 [Polyangiales bacterium]